MPVARWSLWDPHTYWDKKLWKWGNFLENRPWLIKITFLICRGRRLYTPSETSEIWSTLETVEIAWLWTDDFENYCYFGPRGPTFLEGPSLGGEDNMKLWQSFLCHKAGGQRPDCCHKLLTLQKNAAVRNWQLCVFPCEGHVAQVEDQPGMALKDLSRTLKLHHIRTLHGKSSAQMLTMKSPRQSCRKRWNDSHHCLFTFCMWSALRQGQPMWQFSLTLFL